MTTGKDSFLGIAPEVVYGTRVAPTIFQRFRSSTLKANRALIRDEGIIAGRKLPDESQICEGDWTVGGAISLPLFIGGIDHWLDAMIGAETGGAGTDLDPYRWEYLSSELGSLSLQQAIGGTGGTVHPTDFLGCKVNTWAIGVQQGAKATLDVDIVGGGASEAEALATPVFTRPRSYTFAHGTATVGAGARKVKACTVSGNNGLTTDRRFLGSRYIDEPLHGDDVAATAELVCEFVDLSDYNSFRAASFDRFDIELLLVSGNDDLKVTVSGHMTDTPLPDVNSKGALEYPITIEAVGDGSDADGFNIERVNA